MKHTLRSVAIGVTAGVLAATGVTVAVAQIPSTDGTVTACMVKPGGTLRLIDVEAGATCKKGEEQVAWNVQGVPGADGADGADGTNGTNGVSGYEIRHFDREVPPSSTAFLTNQQFCPNGKKAISGGAIGIDRETGVARDTPFLIATPASPAKPARDGASRTRSRNLTLSAESG